MTLVCCKEQPFVDQYLRIVNSCTCDMSCYHLQVHCDMSTCGGGWSLVWKHSYMEVLPLTQQMYYFSDTFRSCQDITAGWCNVDRKGRFNAEEMMIAAYHNNHLVYAYRGRYNHNIDHEWSGGILLDPKVCVDRCQQHVGVPQAPSYLNDDIRLLGIAFDKKTPTDYRANCDTFKISFDNPIDCRWHDCYLPTSISSEKRNTQMTVAIYVR